MLQANRTVAVTMPWELANACVAKPSDESARAKLNQVIFYTNESIRISAILLQPIMPGKMAQLLDSLGVAQDRRTFQHAALGVDDAYGIEPAVLAERGGYKAKHPQASETLFPPKAGIDGDQPGYSKKGKKNMMNRTVKELESS
jgi:methionyl-tRNA synthetase